MYSVAGHTTLRFHRIASDSHCILFVPVVFNAWFLVYDFQLSDLSCCCLLIEVGPCAASDMLRKLFKGVITFLSLGYRLFAMRRCACKNNDILRVLPVRFRQAVGSPRGSASVNLAGEQSSAESASTMTFFSVPSITRPYGPNGTLASSRSRVGLTLDTDLLDVVSNGQIPPVT